MTEEAVQPEPSERGRYAVYEVPDGMLVTRVSGICETCQNCGCGDKREPIGPIPPLAAQAAMLAGQGRIGEATKLLMSNGIKLPGMGGRGRDKGPVRSGRR